MKANFEIEVGISAETVTRNAKEVSIITSRGLRLIVADSSASKLFLDFIFIVEENIGHADYTHI